MSIAPATSRSVSPNRTAPPAAIAEPPGRPDVERRPGRNRGEPEADAGEPSLLPKKAGRPRRPPRKGQESRPVSARRRHAGRTRSDPVQPCPELAAPDFACRLSDMSRHSWLLPDLRLTSELSDSRKTRRHDPPFHSRSFACASRRFRRAIAAQLARSRAPRRRPRLHAATGSPSTTTLRISRAPRPTS